MERERDWALTAILMDKICCILDKDMLKSKKDDPRIRRVIQRSRSSIGGSLSSIAFLGRRPCFNRKEVCDMVTYTGLFSVLTFLIIFAEFVLKYIGKHK